MPLGTKKHWPDASCIAFGDCSLQHSNSFPHLADKDQPHRCSKVQQMVRVDEAGIARPVPKVLQLPKTFSNTALQNFRRSPLTISPRFRS